MFNSGKFSFIPIIRLNQKMFVTVCSLLLASSCLQLSAAKPAITDRLLYGCTFETDLCNMIIEPYSSDNFTWTRFQGSTPSEVTGPDFDHTTLTAQGYYMYTEASEFQPGDVAKLSVPALSVAPPPQGAVCLTFWYNMYGQHIGTLNITQADSDVLWSLSYNQSYGWFQSNVTVRNPSAGILKFVGVRGGQDKGQPYGDIAIDDVFIYDGTCGFDETTTVPTTTIPTTTTTVQTTTDPTTTMSTTLPTTTVPTTVANPTTTTVPITSEVPSTTAQMPITTGLPSTTNNLPTTANIPTTTAGPAITTAVPSTTQHATSAPAAQTTTPQATTTVQAAVTSGPSPGNIEVSGKQTSMTSEGVTSQVVSSQTRGMTTTGMAQTNKTTSSTPTKEAQSGSTQQQSTMWGLTRDNLILILALLSAAILLLILAVVVLACCLCSTKRKYNVERSNNIYTADNSTIDGISTVEAHRGKDNASFDRVSVEY